MSDIQSQNPTQQADDSRNGLRGRSAGRQPAPGDRPAAERSFAGDETGALADRAVEAGRQMQQEALQVSQDLARAGQRAAVQTSDFWRQSLEPLATIHAEVSHWFDDVLRHTTGVGAMRPLRTARMFAGAPMAALIGAPLVDLKEGEDAYHLCIEVPGLAAKDLDLRFNADMLIVSGHKAEERSQSGVYQISERRYGSFERAFPLPTDVDRAQIEARTENGLLKISLPKTTRTSGTWSKVEVRG